MPKAKNSGNEQTPARERRKPARKQPVAAASKPTQQEEDFEHTLRRLVAARDGLEGD